VHGAAVGRDQLDGQQVVTGEAELAVQPEGEAINERALEAMFKQIIANNRAGSWRKIHRQDHRFRVQQPGYLVAKARHEPGV
jgi:hypothetical protein